MKYLIAKSLLWLLGKIGYSVVTHNLDPSLLAVAEKIVTELDRIGPSGEYRRHQALARLIKSGWRERDAALAIELAVRRVSA